MRCIGIYSPSLFYNWILLISCASFYSELKQKLNYQMNIWWKLHNEICAFHLIKVPFLNCYPTHSHPQFFTYWHSAQLSSISSCRANTSQLDCLTDHMPDLVTNCHGIFQMSSPPTIEPNHIMSMWILHKWHSGSNNSKLWQKTLIVFLYLFSFHLLYYLVICCT